MVTVLGTMIINCPYFVQNPGELLSRILKICWDFDSRCSGLVHGNAFFRMFRKNTLHLSSVETDLKPKLGVKTLCQLVTVTIT